jgi:fermentation-respiration switch protein FrsA (DUF1100 family)
LVTAYVLAHLAAVPALSLLTRRTVPKAVNPGRWGVDYSELPIPCSPWGAMPGWLIPGGKDGPVVMVLAGSGGNRAGSVSRTLALGLHRRGYDVLLFDTRGQGDSAGIKTFGIGEARDIVCALDAIALARPHAQVGAVGFSLGAASALRAAGVDSRLEAVAAYASYAETDSELIRSEVAGYGAKGGSIASALVWPPLARLSLQVWSGTLSRIPQPIEAVRHFDGRALLLLHNAGDPLIPRSHERKLEEAARASLLRAHVFPVGGHPPPLLDVHFEDELLATIGDFFDVAFSRPPIDTSR